MYLFIFWEKKQALHQFSEKNSSNAFRKEVNFKVCSVILYSSKAVKKVFESEL